MSSEKLDDHLSETYRSMIQYGHGMLQFGLLTNGGAVLAVLTFIGDLSSKDSHVPDMFLPIVLFVVGTLTTGVGGVSAYVTQLRLFGETRDRQIRRGLHGHVFWMRVTLVLITLSLLCFGLGAVLAALRLR
jgi:hypothetical protein